MEKIWVQFDGTYVLGSISMLHVLMNYASQLGIRSATLALYASRQNDAGAKLTVGCLSSLGPAADLERAQLTKNAINHARRFHIWLWTVRILFLFLFPMSCRWHPCLHLHLHLLHLLMFLCSLLAAPVTAATSSLPDPSAPLPRPCLCCAGHAAAGGTSLPTSDSAATTPSSSAAIVPTQCVALSDASGSSYCCPNCVYAICCMPRARAPPCPL